MRDARVGASFDDVERDRFTPRSRTVRVTARIVFVTLLLVTALGVVLEYGTWTREEVRHGPFPLVAEGVPGTVYLPVQQSRWLACCLRPGDDYYSPPSDLRLWVAGREMGPPHAQHVLIRQGGSTAFSHWGNHVIFAWPTDAENSAATTVTIRYSRRPRTAFLLAVAMAGLGLGLLLYGHAAARTMRRVVAGSRVLAPAPGLIGRCAAAVVRAPVLALRACGYVLLLASALFVASSAYALVTGWALPTTALIRWSGWASWAALHEPWLPHVLLTLAALSVLGSWLSPAAGAVLAVRRSEVALARFCRRWGLLLAMCMFAFCLSAIWAGKARSGDVTAISIVGLIPFSDAGGYYASTHDQAKDGIWNTISLRRPAAAAFRSVLMFFGGFVYANALLLQALLLAAAAYLGAWSVGRWRGPYAGVVFFALTYVCVRSFLPTFLTEPIALVWALLAVPFFVEALRRGSFPHALIGFAMTTLALAVRPGSMFTLPAVALWCVWRFGGNVAQKLRVAVALVAVFACALAGDDMLRRAYGTGDRLTGSNFAYTLCGLSIGAPWSACVEKYMAEYRKLPSEKAATEFLYRRAWENIRAHPSVIVSRLGRSAWEFTDVLPEALWRGYYYIDPPVPGLRLLLYGVASVGLAWVLFRRRERGEIGFWLLMWAAVVGSSAFVYFDDGKRVMAVAYPLVCAFVASGLTGPAVVVSPRRAITTKLARYGVAALSTAVVLCFAIPFIAYATSPARDLVRGQPPSGRNEHLVFGGRRMSGVLVVADDVPLRADIPTLHLSEFAALIKRSGLDDYQGVLAPEPPPIPFGFVTTARLGPASPSYYQYLVPPEVLERREVKAWRFRIRDWNRTSQYGPYWFFVETFEPMTK